MGRPRLEVGKWGRINRVLIAPDCWYAECRVRDQDGIVRRAQRQTTEGVRDRTGAAAERELLKHLQTRVRSAGTELTLESTVRQLWDAYVKQLKKDHRAPDTIARYTDLSKFILAGLAGLTLREANSTTRLEAFLDNVRAKQTIGNAQKTRIVLSGMFSLACRRVEGFGKVNPVRETSPITSAKKANQRVLEAAEVLKLMKDVRESTVPCPELGKGGIPKTSRYKVQTVAEYCASADLADLIIMLAATGLRESELLGIQISGIDLTRKILRIDGKVTRIPGEGLTRISFDDDPKNQNRELSLPYYAIDMLEQRLSVTRKTTDNLLFPSANGTLRDSDAFNRQWRRVRAALGLDWVTAGSFRDWVFTELDEADLTPRKVADQGGHAKPSMSQDKYMKRFKAHPENAAALERAIQTSAR